MAEIHTLSAKQFIPHQKLYEKHKTSNQLALPLDSPALHILKDYQSEIGCFLLVTGTELLLSLQSQEILQDMCDNHIFPQFQSAVNESYC